MAYAAICFYLLSNLMLLIFSLRYLSARQFMEYHAEAAGRDWGAVDPGLQKAVLTMYFVIGGSFLSFSLAGAGLAVQLFQPYGLQTALIAGAPGIVMTLGLSFATLRLKRQTGANAPVIPSLFGLLLNVVGLVLSLGGVP